MNTHTQKTKEMLVLKRKKRTYHGGSFGRIGFNVLKNVFKKKVSGFTAQKIADAVVDGGVKIAANTAKKGLETAVNKIFEKKKKKPSGKRFNTIDGIINGSGIIYE